MMSALGKPAPAAVPALPTGDEQAWCDYGNQMKALAHTLSVKAAVTLWHMKHPKGSGVKRWIPLMLWVGFHRHEIPTVVRVMTAESHGNENADNGICVGGMQIHMCWWRDKWHVTRARAKTMLWNLTAALWIVRHDPRGWLNWATY
jgi:hypothetical protein